VTIFEQRGLLTERYYSEFITIPFLGVSQVKLNLFFLLVELRITEELRHGEEYWALERKLCHALINEEEVYIVHVLFSFSSENVYAE